METITNVGGYPEGEFGYMEPGSLPTIRKGYSKSKLAELADAFVSTLMEYGGNVMEVAEVLSSMETMGETIRKDERFKQSLLDELTKYKGKYVSPSGAKIEACETSVEYDYTINPAWVELSNNISELTKKKKALEEKIKKIPPGFQLVDPETGEALTGPVKSSKSSYKITLAK